MRHRRAPPDAEEAKRTARTIVAFYISSMPDEQLQRHGIDPADLAPIVEALGKGELDKAYELTSPEVAEKLTIAGTPEECTPGSRRSNPPASTT